MSKYDFCTSGLMNALLSVRITLKRANVVTTGSARLQVRLTELARLGARLSVQPQHITF